MFFFIGDKVGKILLAITVIGAVCFDIAIISTLLLLDKTTIEQVSKWAIIGSSLSIGSILSILAFLYICFGKTTVTDFKIDYKTENDCDCDECKCNHN